MNNNELSPQIKKIVDEVNKLKGDYQFQLSHSDMRGETIGNTSSCTNIGGCKPNNCSACD